MAICNGIFENGEPDIKVIKKVNPGPILKCQPIEVSFNNHLRSYKVDSYIEQEDIVHVADLKNIFPLDLLAVRDTYYLSQRATFV